MVKRLMGMLAALLMTPALAGAQMVSIGELRAQAEEMGQWTLTVTDCYGREIDANAAILVPEVERVPVLSASVYGEIAQETRAQIENGGRYADVTDQYGIRDVDFEYEDGLGRTVTGGLHERIFNVRFEGNLTQAASGAALNGAECRDEIDPSALDWDTPHCESSGLTLRTVMKQASEAAGMFFDEQPMDFSLYAVRIYAHPRGLASIDDTELGEKADGFSGGYYTAALRQNLHGLPVLLGASEPYQFMEFEKAQKPKRARPWPLSMMDPVNTITSYDEEEYGLTFVPVREESVIVEDVPLCTLDTVLTSVTELMEKGYVRQVYALRLGYACFYSPEETEASRFCLYPVWEVDCEYAESPAEELADHQEDLPAWERPALWKGEHFRRLIANAQTGKIENPIDLNKNSWDCPEVILW